jgi:hypothetical protein
VVSQTVNAPAAAPEASPAPVRRLAVVLLGLLAASAALFAIRQNLLWGPATVLLLGAAIAVAWQLAAPAPLIGRDSRPESAAGSRVASRLGHPLGLAGLAVAAINASVLAYDWHGSFDWAAPLLLLGIALWSIGLAAGDRQCPDYVPPPAMTAIEWACFAAVVLLGFFFRFYRYTEFPPAGGFCSVEEAFTGRTAAYIIQDGARPWEFVGDVWLPVPFFRYLGYTTTSLRLPFTLVSALTVPALFFLLRELVSVRAALATAALFAVGRWHVIYGRHAHNIFATTLILVVVLYLCARIHRRRGFAPYPWLGFLTGYTLYTYAGFRSTPLYVGLFVALSLGTHLWSERGRAQWSPALRRRFVGLGLAALGFILAVLPLAGQLYKNPTYLFEAAFRSTVVNPNFREGTLGDLLGKKVMQAEAALELFNHTGDDSEVFNLPPTPMLDPVTGLLLVLGAAYCALRWRQRFQGYFLLILVVQLTLGAVAVGHLDVRRLASIIPLLFVLAAFAVDGLLEFFARRGRMWQSLSAVLLLVAVGAAVYDNYRVYFRGMMESERVRFAFQTYYSTVSKYVHELPPNSYVLLVGNTLNFFEDNDYAWFRGDDVPGSVTSDLEPVLSGATGAWSGKQVYVLIIDPYEHDELSELLVRTLPGIECRPWADRDTPPWHHYTSCRLPSQAAPIHVQPTLQARYYRGDAAEPFLERRERALSYALFPNECRLPLAVDQPPCRAEYSGTWQVAEAGRYQLQPEVQGGTLALTLDGKAIGPEPLDLTAGAHAVRGSARFDTLFEAGARLKVQRAGAEKWSLVRFEAGG